jgi:hypothetical protein
VQWLVVDRDNPVGSAARNDHRLSGAHHPPFVIDPNLGGAIEHRDHFLDIGSVTGGRCRTSRLKPLLADAKTFGAGAGDADACSRVSVPGRQDSFGASAQLTTFISADRSERRLKAQRNSGQARPHRVGAHHVPFANWRT